MSNSVDTAFVQQYNSNVYHLAQQKGSRLAPFVRRERQTGESQYFDRIGSQDAQKSTTRHGDTPILNVPHSRRRVDLVDYDWGDLVDKFDTVKTLIDPKSAYAQAAAWAMGRSMDDELIEHALGSAKAGKEGGTSVALGNDRKVVPVASGSAANLNVDALRMAKFLLDSEDIDPEIPRYIAINASALMSLLAETEVTSSDYNTVKALVQGQLDTFMGFKFIRTERLITQPNAFSFDTSTGLYSSGGSSITTGKSMIAWAGDGLLLSVGMNPIARIQERPDKKFSWQIYNQMSIGAVRMEEEKVVEIICDQS